MMDEITNWLLSGPAWVEYRARVDLLDLDQEDSTVRRARQGMLEDAQVQAVVSGLADWPGQVLNSHKSAGQAFHRLNFLAYLGLRAGDPGMDPVIERILAHRSSEGLALLPMNIGASHGGSGQDVWGWALCDAPLTLRALARLGLANQPGIQTAVQSLVDLVRDNGWPCAVSPELGGFRGPGRKGDPCPFATLAMLKLLGEFPDLRASPAARSGLESLLALWENRRDQHPYIFYMGTDFCKLKAPLVWYDLLHVLDTLSLFPEQQSDPRRLDMLQTALEKAGPDGRFTPESVWMQWKDWEFGQKKVPSRWLTLLIKRIEKRGHNELR